MRKKTWSLVLCAAMAASMMAGCGAKQETAATTAATTAAPAADTAAAATTAPAAEAAKPESKGNDKLVVGFAQIGQESGWRDAETASIQFYAGQNLDTIDLKFADAQQKQENQIKAIKSFIDMGVDVSGLAPVVET